MWLTRLSIQRPVFVIVLMSVFLVLGWWSRRGMKIEQNPQVDIPYVTITTVYPGTGPAEMETLVTKPIEDAVSAVNNVRHIYSSSQYGISYVQLEFYVGTDTNVALSDVRQKVDAARRLLPRDVEPPVVEKFDIGAMPVLYLGMRGDRSVKELRYLADTRVKFRLAQVPGVGSVSVSGGDVREIRIAVDKQRLHAYGLSINDVVGAIYRANVNIPSGHITEGERDYDARLIGEFQSVEQLKAIKLPLTQPGGAGLSLNIGDVAEVLDTVAERDQITRVWYRATPPVPPLSREGIKGGLVGSDSVGIVITKLSDANTVEVIHAVKEELARLEQELPGNVRFIIAQDQAPQIEAALEDVTVSLVLGALLAVIVVFLFLHNLRGTFICAIAIPTSLIATFIPMHFAGFTLNQMTMLGLSLVVGILVDDSIVVLENIYRHLKRGEQPKEAAYNGRSEIGLAAITITLVDVVVFLPMAWMGGIVGQFFRQFGLTVAVSTLFSLLVSFTVTPMLASRWYKLGEEIEATGGVFGALDRFYNWLDNRLYRRVLDWSLRHRPHVIVLGGAAMVLVMVWSGPRLKFGFIPVTDQGQLAITVELPPGASLQATDAVLKDIEQRIADIPEIKSMFTSAGTISGGARTLPERGRQFGQIAIQLYDKIGVLDRLNPFSQVYVIPAEGSELRDKGSSPLTSLHAKGGMEGVNSQPSTLKVLRTRPDFVVLEDIKRRIADVPNARISAVNMRGFGGTDAPVQLELLGFDLQRMRQVAEQIRARIATIPGIVDPDISLRPGKPEAQIVVDRVKASELGLDVTAIGLALRHAIEGNIDAKYREYGEQFDIRVRFRDFDRSNVEDIKDVIVGSKKDPQGTIQPIRVQDVATVTLGEGPSKIERKDRLRKVTVSAYLAPGVAAGNITNVIREKIADVPLGDIQLNFGGEAQVMRDEFPHLFSTLFLSVVLVYLLMAALFDNLLHPFTIQLSLPMALVGAILALVLANQMLSIVSLIGFIMLVGLVQKNAILLIDYTNTLRARGMARDEAIKEAGPTRLRPILMTTIAMVFGMLPIALGIGRAAEMRAPLATGVIGGLILSTLLTLVMIPVIYTLFDDFLAWVGRVLGIGAKRERR
ncbi:MAG: efflux RND transporter permease subunit [Abditibacteriales bacterium]|nr:efflux RND transporter permease subunit [Abditibacteriales bacterium]MDW8366442.1 efflux RND transporter permease subunit [Abditibacteriales bacterium]